MECFLSIDPAVGKTIFVNIHFTKFLRIGHLLVLNGCTINFIGAASCSRQKKKTIEELRLMGCITLFCFPYVTINDLNIAQGM